MKSEKRCTFLELNSHDLRKEIGKDKAPAVAMAVMAFGKGKETEKMFE